MGTLKIDTLLYKTPTLKGIIMDNYALEQQEMRPLNELRELAKEHAREYCKALMNSQLVIPTGTVTFDQILDDHEKEFYQ